MGSIGKFDVNSTIEANGNFFFVCERIQMKFCLRVRPKRSNKRGEFHFVQIKNNGNIAKNSVAN